MLRRVALIRTDVSEELSASIIGVTIGSPISVTLMMEALSSSETSVFTRATRRNIPKASFFFLHNFGEYSTLYSARLMVKGSGVMNTINALFLYFPSFFERILAAGVGERAERCVYP
jgi:hypothetical protein